MPALKDSRVGSCSSWSGRHFVSLVREKFKRRRVLWRFCASRLALPGGMKQKSSEREGGAPTAQSIHAERVIVCDAEQAVVANRITSQMYTLGFRKNLWILQN